MPGNFGYSLRFLSTICNSICDCLLHCCWVICSWFCSPCWLRGKHPLEGNTENDHLLAQPTSAIAFREKDLCRSILNSFSQKYLRSTLQRLRWDASNTVNSRTIVICAKISRLQDDIQATLNDLDFEGEPKIMLVVIHACEPGVTPENLVRYLPDDRLTSFTNVIYSALMDACYNCLTNREAAAEIKRFIK